MSRTYPVRPGRPAVPGALRLQKTASGAPPWIEEWSIQNYNLAVYGEAAARPGLGTACDRNFPGPSALEPLERFDACRALSSCPPQSP
ncbi:protein of unknown function [Candidatus Methylocalor cossyra]|uniref:Uncharacterized protein n=1 Tax=Candidatus Methylocalor cossyra TaxID=3108543 RepID=A0ABM9NIF8_9GAMM